MSWREDVEVKRDSPSSYTWSRASSSSTSLLQHVVKDIPGIAKL